jgi:hypothetical protein
MTNRVLLKRSSVANSVPATGNLEYGELALNYTDGNLFFKTASNAVTLIASTQTANFTGNVTADYFIGNANIQYTANTAPDSSGNLIGAQWYNTSTDALYEWQTDGTSTYWVDITGPVIGSVGAESTYGNANVAVYLPTYTGNLSPNIVAATGNVSGSNVTTGGLITATGNITGGNLLTGGKLQFAGGSQLRPLGANLDIVAGNGSYVNLTTFDESSSMGVDNGGGYIVTAGGTWGFSTTGNLTLPGATAGENIATQSGYITVGNLLIGQGGALFNSNNDSWALYGNLSDPGTTIFIPSDADAGNGLALYFENQISNVEIRSGGTWVFDTAGNLSAPGNVSAVGNIAGGNVITTGAVYSNFNTNTANTGSFMATGGNTKGGTGYLDFLVARNTSGGATNPYKWFRLNSTGGLEIVNSAYSTNLLNLSDAGALSIPGPFSISGKQAVNGPAFSAYANASLQTITSGSQQKVLFQTEEFDTNSNYASSTFTPTVEGYYQLNAEVRLDGATGTGEMMIILYKNGAEYKRGTNQSGTQIASSFWAMQVSSVAYANGTGDYFEIYVQQGSGGNVTVTAVNNPAITWFNGCMLRGA